MKLINSSLKNFLKFYSTQDKVIFYAFLLNSILIFSQGLYFSLNAKNLPSQVPLFYSLPWGEAQLGSKPQLLLLPSISLLICLVNLTIVWHLHRSLVTLRRTLLLAAAAVSLMMTLTLTGIVSIFI